MAESAAPSPEPTPKPKAKLGVGGVIFVALVVLCCGGLMLKSSLDKDEPDGIDAKVMCEKFVEDRLKAPSTADYSGEVATESGGVWTVTGKVDAQNSFGAKIRSSFACRMRVSGETWTLTQPVTIIAA